MITESKQSSKFKTLLSLQMRFEKAHRQQKTQRKLARQEAAKEKIKAQGGVFGAHRKMAIVHLVLSEGFTVSFRQRVSLFLNSTHMESQQEFSYRYKNSLHHGVTTVSMARFLIGAGYALVSEDDTRLIPTLDAYEFVNSVDLGKLLSQHNYLREKTSFMEDKRNRIVKEFNLWKISQATRRKSNASPYLKSP